MQNPQGRWCETLDIELHILLGECLLSSVWKEHGLNFGNAWQPFRRKSAEHFLQRIMSKKGNRNERLSGQRMEEEEEVSILAEV